MNEQLEIERMLGDGCPHDLEPGEHRLYGSAGNIDFGVSKDDFLPVYPASRLVAGSVAAMMEYSPTVWEDLQEVIAAQTPCIFCGKPSAVAASTAWGCALCSQECLQSQLDTMGGTVHFPDGSTHRLEPGQARLTQGNPNRQQR